ncbi:hypothetical protein [Brevundimonas sp. UBA7534]|uniref:hypothetical protein n=1 Tax=Brevundimonas sp. UBA7534 TaxID=1946138 RepID=UPI0025C4AD41|nr:hypothetical protein [Brevundimonas sp. UBA7534]
MIPRFKSGPIRFTRGRRFYEVAHAYDGKGFIGLCDGRIIATAPDPAAVARAMIKTAGWQR